jgi:hypothetical protein
MPGYLLVAAASFTAYPITCRSKAMSDARTHQDSKGAPKPDIGLGMMALPLDLE